MATEMDQPKILPADPTNNHHPMVPAALPAATTEASSPAAAVVVAAVEAPANNAVPDAAAVATSEPPANTTDVDIHKTAAAPKPILKEARIAVAENKAQNQINKWIKGDPSNPKIPIITKPLAVNLKPAAAPVVAQQPAVPPPAASKAEPVIVPKAATTTTIPIKLSQEELPAVRDDLVDGSRKRRRMAAKTVLKPAPEEPATKKPKPAATKAVTSLNTKAPPAAKARKIVATKTAPKSGSRSSPEVWSGAPDDDLGAGFQWSAGWIKKKFERQSGQSKGTFDSYWYTPALQKRLRSIAEVKRFMTALKDQGGDEEAAWVAFKK